MQYIRHGAGAIRRGEAYYEPRLLPPGGSPA
jgi:hypothetical protein